MDNNDQGMNLFDSNNKIAINANSKKNSNSNRDDDFFDINIITSNIITQTSDTENFNDIVHNTDNDQSQEQFSSPSSNISNCIMIEHRLSIINEFEVKIKNADLDSEACNYLQNPHNENNIYYPNFDNFEAKLTSKSCLIDLRNSIRNALENELERSQRYEMLIGNRLKSLPSSSTTSNTVQIIDDDQGEESPDLFKDYDDEVEVCEVIINASDCKEKNESNNADEKNSNVNLPLEPSMISVETMEICPEYVYNQSSDSDQNVILDMRINNNENVDSTVEYDDNMTSRRKELISKVENFIIKLLEDLVGKGSINFHIKQKMKLDNYDILNGILTLKPNNVCSQKNIAACTVKGEHNFSLIMYVLSEIYRLLIKGLTCTVRELYYKDTVLAENQINISNAIKDICCLFDCAPWEFGIMSSCKGLISGPILITLSNGEILDCSLNMGGTILPFDTVNIQKLQTTAEYVLLVEKDTVFEKLLKYSNSSMLEKHFILMTGKGFPDINTRVMLKKIWEHLKIPIYGIFDSDPFGIEILLVYKYGSRTMGFTSDTLACPFIHWIGIHPSEINTLTISSVILNAKDKYKIKAILKRNYINDEIRNELKIMVKMNRKAEIEGLLCSSCNFFMNDYIPNKIKNNSVI